MHGGLPPPTRGIRLHGMEFISESGSTPAHAGNTWGFWECMDKAAVYPRPRGEYKLYVHHEQESQGLPPPTRGIPPKA